MSARIRTFALVTALLVATGLGACGSPGPSPDVPGIVPRPVELTSGGRPFVLDEGATVVADPALAQPAAALVELVHDDTGLTLAAGSGSSEIRLTLDEGVEGIDGYRLRVDEDGVEIAAAGPGGAFAAVQTLRQLVPPGDDGASRPVPAVEVVDRARYAYRGAMLDVARHFFRVEDVERYIDDVAALKVNHLHLHLTDDQGWRIAITSWPRLTEVGAAFAVDHAPGGFYTQDDYRAIVAHAAARGVTIVPEVDMPGHTNAALASYAELNPSGKAAPPYIGIEVGFSTLDPSSETTYRFVEDVLDELAALTPGPYLHIGGDESDATSDDEYAAFVTRVAQLAADTGKTVVGWHDIVKADSLPPGTIGQYWGYTEPDGRSLTPQVQSFVERGGQLIMSPADVAYLDMKYNFLTPHGLTWARGYTDLEEAYSWDPAAVLPGVDDDAILGVEAPMWTETLRTIQQVEWMAFPRLAALAEIAWTPQDDRDFDDFTTRVAALGTHWDASGLSYRQVDGVPWAGGKGDGQG